MYIELFSAYLKTEKKLSENSIAAYISDIREFEDEIKAKSIGDLLQVENPQVVSFLLKLKENKKSPSTINRKLASIRSFYKFLISQGKLTKNPTTNIKTPRIIRKDIEYLSIEEVEKLLDINLDSKKQIRDKAIMELLYATGIRVNELIAANLEDINLRIGFFTCRGSSGKARIVPIGRLARKAMERYLDAREEILGDKEEDALFVNLSGGRLTRQGLWKLFKVYGEKAGIEEEKMTPHILRNSFGVHMVKNGADLKSLQELMGHEDLAATQIYLSVTKNRIKDVYDKTHPRA